MQAVRGTSYGTARGWDIGWTTARLRLSEDVFRYWRSIRLILDPDKTPPAV